MTLEQVGILRRCRAGIPDFRLRNHCRICRWVCLWVSVVDSKLSMDGFHRCWFGSNHVVPSYCPKVYQFGWRVVVVLPPETWLSKGQEGHGHQKLTEPNFSVCSGHNSIPHFSDQLTQHNGVFLFFRGPPPTKRTKKRKWFSLWFPFKITKDRVPSKQE